MAAIMLALVVGAMISSCSAVSIGDNFNYIGNTTGPLQKVLIGQNLQFNLTEGSNNFSSTPKVYRYVAGQLENTYTPDANGRIYNVNWPPTGAYYVSDNPSGPRTQAQLSVEEPIIPLILRVGSTEVTSIVVGTRLILDTSGINLFDEDRVDLTIIDPDGILIKTDVNGQVFADITVRLLTGTYGRGGPGITTSGWKLGNYTFQIETIPEHACGLRLRSEPRGLTSGRISAPPPAPTTPTPTPSLTPTLTPTLTATPTPVATPTGTPAPAVTTTPAISPPATPTPAPEESGFEAVFVFPGLVTLAYLLRRRQAKR
ncbi:MAG: hypothetical protein EFT35_06020 [Methanophagales archaeon ANME-1-THS]|nr:MAG: hypothetical protein EFT35_06020 [Methanophagales archaeon ANME-1-THS]